MIFPGIQSLIGLSLSFILLEAAQIPFSTPYESTSTSRKTKSFAGLENETDNWDINIAPNENATGHLIFETVNSFMQHWPNTRYRNGVSNAIIFLQQESLTNDRIIRS